jgi:hypothetical protein
MPFNAYVIAEGFLQKDKRAALLDRAPHEFTFLVNQGSRPNAYHLFYGWMKFVRLQVDSVRTVHWCKSPGGVEVAPSNRCWYANQLHNLADLEAAFEDDLIKFDEVHAANRSNHGVIITTDHFVKLNGRYVIMIGSEPVFPFEYTKRMGTIAKRRGKDLIEFIFIMCQDGQLVAEAKAGAEEAGIHALIIAPGIGIVSSTNLITIPPGCLPRNVSAGTDVAISSEFYRARAQAFASLKLEASEQEVHESTKAWARTINDKRAASCTGTGRAMAASILGIPPEDRLFAAFHETVVAVLAANGGLSLQGAAGVERGALFLHDRLPGDRAALAGVAALLEQCTPALSTLSMFKCDVTKAAMLLAVGDSVPPGVLDATTAVLEAVAAYQNLDESAVLLATAAASKAIAYADSPELRPDSGQESADLQDLAKLVTFGVAKDSAGLLSRLEPTFSDAMAFEAVEARAMKIDFPLDRTPRSAAVFTIADAAWVLSAHIRFTEKLSETSEPQMVTTSGDEWMTNLRYDVFSGEMDFDHSPYPWTGLPHEPLSDEVGVVDMDWGSLATEASVAGPSATVGGPSLRAHLRRACWNLGLPMPAILALSHSSPVEPRDGYDRLFEVVSGPKAMLTIEVDRVVMAMAKRAIERKIDISRVVGWLTSTEPDPAAEVGVQAMIEEAAGLFKRPDQHEPSTVGDG